MPTPEPTPVPAVIIPVVTEELRTTEGLVGVIPPAPVAGQNLQYIVQPGETLWTIAFNYYGSAQPGVINRILAANRNVIPPGGHLTAGMVITLPAQGLRPPVTQAQLEDAAGLYLVRSGDTLGRIAQHFYGEAAQWRRIFEANRDRISNPNVIVEGQWLVIPS